MDVTNIIYWMLEKAFSSAEALDVGFSCDVADN